MEREARGGRLAGGSTAGAEDRRAFPPDAVRFLEDLAEDNGKPFFDANRHRYEQAVRRPLEDLLGEAERRYGPGRVMRPNRDVRFSPDKSPYRTTAGMWAGGGTGAVYLRLSRSGIDAGGGLYEPSRDQLDRGRSTIARGGRAAEELRRVLERLVARGFEVTGPSLRTAPRGYPRDHPEIDLLRLQHYAAVRPLPASATRHDVAAAWRAVEPLIAWVDAHVGPATTPR